MEITLKALNLDNYEEVCDLSVSKEQEDYVAENMWSIVESKYHPSYETRAIYSGDKPVGFFMWVPETTTKTSIWRFMVDEKYQKQGIGRKALHLAIEEMRENKELEVIEICYNPENPVAYNFYASFGFKEMGLDEDGDDMLAVLRIR
ncbi:GNAT family N-acetyltransferase [Sporosarcina aquimarina]|uniref:GNAT family N-acetyltransferase n=1 Tax=Sporosarcina aquimarina TaxID=114975 RepID=UPI00203DA3CB|nr:GNAT family N-acetyltransferase [Sporosarcina aquimarina]MCM3758162.1 GNAT family N-acetyltransferase [Sporosarcina aquimarina]